MTTAGKGATNLQVTAAGADRKEDAARPQQTELQQDSAEFVDTRIKDRRSQTLFRAIERRRSARRHSDRVAASFTSAFVAQWLGQEIAGGEPGDEITLRRSANLVYAAVQEREAQYFRTLGQPSKKTHDYS